MGKRWALIAMMLSFMVSVDVPSTADLVPLREISYYSRNNAWLDFWRNWSQTRDEMAADLDTIRDLGANTVRIFIHPSVFGYPAPAPEYLDRLKEALDLIDEHGLNAHVNLFDCWWSWNDVTGSKQWLQAVVEPHRNDGRVAVWELQNEVNLDSPDVRSWVQQMFPYLKQMAGNTPCTVSVGQVEWLDDVRDLTSPTLPDIYSLHWYPSSLLSWTSPFPSIIDRARALIGDAELLIGEFGHDTYRGSETDQANLYRDVLYYARQKGPVHLGAWTLYDFPMGTTQCDDLVPAPLAELYFGIYRLDRSPKLAQAVLRDAFHGQFPSSPSPAIINNSSFEDLNLNSKYLESWCPWDEDWSGERWFAQDCTTTHSGDCSVRVSGVSTMTVGLYHCPGFTVASGRSYTLEGFVRTKDLDGAAWIAFSWFNQGEVWLGSDTRSEPITVTDSMVWMPLRIPLAEPPVEASYVQVYLQVDTADPATRVWFDDVTMLPHKSYMPVVVRQSEMMTAPLPAFTK